MENAGNVKMNILVVGDWMIDQHWVCGIHRSSSSSRTGKIHLRCLNMNEGAVNDLCGAGASAAVIYRAFSEIEDCEINMTGVGLWHNGDSYFLKNMLLKAGQRMLQAPGQITTSEFKKNPVKNIDLVNIAPILGEEDIYTTRIVRIYKHSRSNIEHLSRIDMESPIPNNNPYWIMPESKSDPNTRNSGNNSQDPCDPVNRILTELKGNKFDAVVVKCLNKGVVSPKLIEGLKSRYKSLPWYISTKKWVNRENSKLLDALRGVNCRLFVIPKRAVDEAKRIGHTTKWLTIRGYETKAAVDMMITLRDKLKEKPKPSTGSSSEESKEDELVCEPLIAVFPAGHRILALESNVSDENKGSLIIQKKKDTLTNPLPLSTPFASIMFGALVAMDLNKVFLYKKSSKICIETEPLSEGTERCLRKALHFTRNYIKQENERITDPDDWKPQKKENFLDLKNLKTVDENSDWHSRLALSDAKKIWQNAFKGLGIIQKSLSNPEGKKKTGPRMIELSRASVEVDGYICLDDKKRNALQRLIIALEKFRKDNRGKSSSCLIKAPPGSGKTRLARSLAKSSRYDFLDFNITLMNSRNDLINMFDRIATEQVKAKGKPLMVFVDEINASLNAQPVYSSFLAPLEDGVYVRAEKKLHIDPCFWIFAGTIKDDVDEKRKEKWIDFQSRLTMSDIELFMPGEDGGGRKIEGRDQNKGDGKNKIPTLACPLARLPRCAKGYIQRVCALWRALKTDQNPAQSWGFYFFRRPKTEPESMEWYDYSKTDLTRRLEMVYIGCTVLISTFDDITEISDKVLFLFWILGGKKRLTIREFVQFIKSFQDIQRGQVSEKNIDTDFLARRGVFEISWLNLKELIASFNGNKGGSEIQLPEEFNGLQTSRQDHSTRVNIFKYWHEIKEEHFVKIQF